MQQVHPAASFDRSHDNIGSLYPWPEGRSWLRANMVSTIDGAAFAPGGRSRDISTDADHELFVRLRADADVIIVGAGTARDEGYRPAKIRPEYASLRQGRGPTPHIAIVTRSLELDPDSPLVNDENTIVVTCASSSAEKGNAIAARTDVLICGDDDVDFVKVCRALAERGLSRQHCEGGPSLLGAIAAAGCLDELLLTLSPYLAGGSYDGVAVSRILAGVSLPGAPNLLRLQHVLTQDDALFMRYTRVES